MKKQRFFIVKGDGYGSGKFYFQNLDGAMKMFKYLIEGNAVEVDHINIPQVKKPDEDNYIPDDSFHYVSGEPKYHLYSEMINIYTKKEIAEISVERKKKIKALKKGGKK